MINEVISTIQDCILNLEDTVSDLKESDKARQIIRLKTKVQYCDLQSRQQIVEFLYERINSTFSLDDDYNIVVGD